MGGLAASRGDIAIGGSGIRMAWCRQARQIAPVLRGIWAALLRDSLQENSAFSCATAYSDRAQSWIASGAGSNSFLNLHDLEHGHFEKAQTLRSVH